jgi:hypothetical protein
VLPLVAPTNVMYFPFPGRVVGHPSVLEGSVEEIAESAWQLTALRGVHGLDLLAYRFAGDVPRLMDAVVGASIGPVVIAGSVDSDARIHSVQRSGAWAFTVGTAVFDHAFPVGRSAAAQVDHVLQVAASPADAGRATFDAHGQGNAAASSRAASEA